MSKKLHSLVSAMLVFSLMTSTALAQTDVPPELPIQAVTPSAFAETEIPQQQETQPDSNVSSTESPLEQSSTNQDHKTILLYNDRKEPLTEEPYTAEHISIKRWKILFIYS